jgi:two-component system response regulator
MTRTILIIDDNRDDVEITKMALARIDRGLKVEIAWRGEAALEFLQSGKALPALILLDLKMPGMSGLDTLRKIRADERLQHLPVIIVTSSSLEADQQKGQEAGADGFLHKAFDVDRFERDLKSVLDRGLNRMNKECPPATPGA